jgi:hypothetical protein
MAPDRWLPRWPGRPEYAGDAPANDAVAFNAHSLDGRGSGLVQHVSRAPARPRPKCHREETCVRRRQAKHALHLSCMQVKDTFSAESSVLEPNMAVVDAAGFAPIRRLIALPGPTPARPRLQGCSSEFGLGPTSRRWRHCGGRSCSNRGDDSRTLTVVVTEVVTAAEYSPPCACTQTARTCRSTSHHASCATGSTSRRGRDLGL